MIFRLPQEYNSFTHDLRRLATWLLYNQSINVHDNFLTQLVNSPTREDNILDLVLLSALEIVDNLIVGEPLSDHNAMTFSITRWPYQRRDTNNVTFSYSKADWVYQY